jgi:hypothetical protein
MLFVAVLKARGRPVEESTGRRLDWTYPENVKVLAEYWCANDDMSVVTIFEADDAAAISSVSRDWRDLFEVQISPAITGEHGLELARRRTG